MFPVDRYFPVMEAVEPSQDLGHSSFERSQLYRPVRKPPFHIHSVKNLAANPFCTIEESQDGLDWAEPFSRPDLTEIFPG